MPLLDRKRHNGRALMEVVSIGKFPKRLKASPGHFFEIGTQEKSLQDLQSIGMTSVLLSVDSGDKPKVQDVRLDNGDKPEVQDVRLLQGYEQMVREITEAVKRNVKVEEEQEDVWDYATAFSRESYSHMVIRRLFSDWVRTADGKAAVKKSTQALKAKLDNETISDFVSESKSILQKFQKAQDDDDTKAEAALGAKLQLVKDVASLHLSPWLPGDGYVQLLSAISLANDAVHHTFDEKELSAIERGALKMCAREGSEWILFFANDLRKRLKSKK